MPAPRQRIRTPQQDAGTLKGLLFHLTEEMRGKERELSRLIGDVAYLRRRKKKLEREICYMAETSKEKVKNDAKADRSPGPLR